MITFGQPGPGAMGVPCRLWSPSRAAWKPPIMTVMLPMAIPFGAGDTHTMPPGSLFATAAGLPPMSTVGTVATGVIGPPTCGFGPSISEHNAMSPARNAGPMGIVALPPRPIPNGDQPERAADQPAEPRRLGMPVRPAHRATGTPGAPGTPTILDDWHPWYSVRGVEAPVGGEM